MVETDPYINPAQRRRLFAMAREAGFSKEGIDRLVKGDFGVESKSRIPAGLYERICARLTPRWAAHYNQDPSAQDLFDERPAATQHRHTMKEIQDMFY